MNLPNLFIPGFPKSGTSSLHSMLIQHKEIFAASKEPHTYSWDIRYEKRREFFLPKYANVQTKYILDSSTSYMVSGKAVNRILNDAPKAKFIIIARDPIDRIVSHLNWMSSLGYVNKEYLDEIESQIDKPYNYRNHYNGNYKSYLDFSMYGKHMERFTNVVPSENYLFLLFEEVFDSWTEVKSKIGEFLSLDLSSIGIEEENKTIYNKESSKKNTSFYKRLKNRLIYELKILNGFPRTNVVRNPIYQRIKRSDVVDLLLPYLNEDLEKLKKLGFDISKWKTSTSIKIDN